MHVLQVPMHRQKLELFIALYFLFPSFPFHFILNISVLKPGGETQQNKCLCQRGLTRAECQMLKERRRASTQNDGLAQGIGVLIIQRKFRIGILDSANCRLKIFWKMESLLWCSGLRIQCCHSCGIGLSCSLDSSLAWELPYAMMQLLK